MCVLCVLFWFGRRGGCFHFDDHVQTVLTIGNVSMYGIFQNPQSERGMIIGKQI